MLEPAVLSALPLSTGPNVDDLRVLVVADDPLARAGLAAVLTGEPGAIVTGQAGSDDDILALATDGQPDVLAWDLGWEPAAGMEHLADFADDLPPVLALLPDDSAAAAAWTAGARGLLHRNASPAAVVAALRTLLQGLVVLAPDLAFAALSPHTDAPTPTTDNLLTSRELQVLQLLAEGLPNKVLAERLGISQHTVKFHVNAILGKLGAQSRTEAVVIATRQGLLLL